MIIDLPDHVEVFQPAWERVFVSCSRAPCRKADVILGMIN